MMRTPARLERSLALALALLLSLATSALGAPGEVREFTRSGYSFDPETERIYVKHRIALTNEARKGSVKRWGAIHVPAGATELTVGPRGTELEALEEDALGTTYSVVLQPLRPRQKRVVEVRYQLPASIAGLPLTTRVEPEYARFCWGGVGEEVGSVRARVPGDWLTVTSQGTVETTSDGSVTTIEAVDAAFAGAFYACTDAFLGVRPDRVYILGPTEQLITIDGWASDAGWKDAVSQAVATHLPEMQALVGVPMPVPELRIQEVARVMPYDTAADYRPDDLVLYMPEGVDEPSVATVALARTWFNPTTVAEPWLEQGLSLWTGLTTLGLPCPEPGPPPFEPPPRLDEWSPPAPARAEIDRLALAWQGRVACGIVAEVAAAIGPEAMREVTAQLAAGSEPAGWREWLAAVEPRLAATEDADANLARERLLEYGVTTESALADHDDRVIAALEALRSGDADRAAGAEPVE